MSGPSDPQSPGGAKSAFLAKPKPYSIERRFRLMQAGSMGVFLILMSLILLGAFSLHKKLERSLQILQQGLSINREFRSAHQAAALAFWELYDSQPGSSLAVYQEKIREEASALDRYDDLSLTEVEQYEINQLRALEKRFRIETEVDLKDRDSGPDVLAKRQAIGHLSSEIIFSLGRLTDMQIREVGALNDRLEKFSRWVALNLLLLTVFGFAVVAWFRDAHRRYLWQPLDQLRRLAGEMRRRNLNVSMEIPQNIEIGSLVGGFLDMERELASMRDGLEQKVAERTVRLEEAQNELLQAAKLASLGQLVSGVAHEINNPLTSILGFSEVLLNRPEADAAVQRPLRLIREEALRVRHLVANLTSFARRAPSRAQRIDLRKLLTHLSDLRQYQLLANNIFLHLQPAKDPVWAIADPDQLTQVLLNLVLNSEQAIQDSRPRGDIWVSCQAEKGVARLSVKDNGSGVNPAIRDRIFDPFFTTKPPGEGTGLGLSITHGIVQQHHGWIEMESKPGEGTTFVVQLPVAPAEPRTLPDSFETAPGESPVFPVDRAAELEKRKALVEVPADTPPLSAPEKEKSSPEYHVLVIDDEQGILEMVNDALERLHCSSTLIQGSTGALDAIERGKFDLILCDLKMPGQNGLDILRFTREKRPDLLPRFLLMTGNLADAEKNGAELAGVRILPKPFTLARLRETVEEIFAGKTPA